MKPVPAAVERLLLVKFKMALVPTSKVRTFPPVPKVPEMALKTTDAPDPTVTLPMLVVPLPVKV